jgi:hypothetical protein
MKRAPKKLSEAMRMALKDLYDVELDPRYTVSMGDWHKSSLVTADGSCAVCFAGAVMAKTIATRTTKTTNPWDDYPESWARVFNALNLVRDGEVGAALDGMGLLKGNTKNFQVVRYEIDKFKWRKDMHMILAYLERQGL